MSAKIQNETDQVAPSDVAQPDQRLIALVRSQMLDQGLSWIVMWLRFIMVTLIIVRFNIIPAVMGKEVKLLDWVSLIYALYVIVLILLRSRRRLAFSSQRSFTTQVLIDVVYICLVYWTRNNVESDTFFFFLLPLLLACRYLSGRAVTGLVILILALLLIVSSTVTGVNHDNILPPPFQSPMRYLLVIMAGGLRFLFYYHIETFEQIKALLSTTASSSNQIHLHRQLPEIIGFLKPLDEAKANTNLIRKISDKLFSRPGMTKNELFEAALQLVAEELHCESAAIFVVENGRACRVMATGIPAEAAERPEIYEVGQGLTGGVLQWSPETRQLIGQLQFCNQVDSSPEVIAEYVDFYRQTLPSGQLKHLMATPIEDEDGIIGILRVMNRLVDSRTLQETGFTVRDKEILSMIISLVNSAWRQNSHFRIMEQLINVGKKLAKASPRAEIYQQAQLQAVELLVAEDCSIFEIDETGEYLRLVESTTLRRETFESHKIQLRGREETSLLTKVVHSGEAYWQGLDFEQDANFNFHNLPSQKCHTLLVLPFFDHLKRCLGLVMVRNKLGSDTNNRFGRQDKKAAELFTSLLGSAVQGELLYEQKGQQKERRLKMLTELQSLHAKIIATLHEPLESLKEIANIAKELMEAELVCIMPYYDHFQGSDGVNDKWVTFSQGWYGPLKIDPPRPRGMTWRTLNAENGYLIEAVSGDDPTGQANPLLAKLNIGQVLGLPLRVQGHNYGVIFFDYTKPRNFEHEREILYLANLIADVTALILINAEYLAIRDLKETRTLTTLKFQENTLKDITDGVSILTHTLLEDILSVRNRLDLALRDESIDLNTRRYINKARGYNERVNKTMTYIMDYNLMRSEGQPLELLDMQSVIDELVAYYQERAQANSISLSCNSANNLPLVYFSRAIAYSVLDNLISNALEFTPPKGQINIKSWYDPSRFYISVCDTGRGMDAETKRKLFKFPFRGKQQADRAVKGTGLGLYLANQLLELHKGRMWIDQSNLGKGTIITLELPIASDLMTFSVPSDEV